MNKRWYGIGLGLVALAAVAAAAIQEVTVKWAPKAGTTYTYKATGEFDFQGMNITFTARTIDKVLSVDDGKVTIESAQVNGKAVFEGQEIDVPDAPPLTTVFASTGEVLEVRGEMADESSVRVANLQSFRYPEGPMTVGKTWEVNIPADAKKGVVAASGKWTVAGFEKVGKYDTMKVTFEVNETEGAEKAGMSGTVWVDVTDGVMVKFDGNLKNFPFAQAPAPMNGKFKLERE